MTGETHDNDECVPFDDDRLDEDFVLEDLVEEDEDAYEAPSAEVDGDSEDASEEDEVAAEDLLFADEEPVAEASETFEGASFSEEEHTDWCGDDLELDEQADEPGEYAEQEELQAATESVAAELGSLLEAEEGFALEEDVDLEVVNEDADAAGEPTTFVLDDGEDLWSEVEPEEVVAGPAPTEQAPAALASIYADAETEPTEEFTLEDELAEEPLELEQEFTEDSEAPATAGEGYELFAELVDGDEPEAEPTDALFGSDEDADQIMVTLVRLLTHDVAVITMPPVRQMPEAIFIGVTHPHGRSGSDDESAPLRVFYLEAGLDQPMLGEMTADGRHGSRAQTCKPQLEHFVALLDDVLAA